MVPNEYDFDYDNEDEFIHYGNCIREQIFNQCESIVEGRGPRNAVTFKRWFGTDKLTYFRVLKLLKQSLSVTVTAAAMQAAAQEEDEGVLRLLIAKQNVKKVIMTENDQQRDSWTVERALQFLLMYYTGLVITENSDEHGFKQANKLKTNMTVLLHSILKVHWPITVSIIKFLY